MLAGKVACLAGKITIVLCFLQSGYPNFMIFMGFNGFNTITWSSMTWMMPGVPPISGASGLAGHRPMGTCQKSFRNPADPLS